MKKTITLLTVAAIAAASGTSAGADKINGVQVTSNDGHTITLEDGSIARIDGNHVYMDGIGEVILAPDIVPPAVPSQQAPQQQLTPQATPPAAPQVQQQTPAPIYQNPAAPTTLATPTKAPSKPLDQVVNVPLKTYPQAPATDDLVNPQAIEENTTVIEDTQKVKPVVIPAEILNSAQAATETPETDVKAPIGTIAPDVPKNATEAKPEASKAAEKTDSVQAQKTLVTAIKVPTGTNAPKATENATAGELKATAHGQAPAFVTDELPQTGDSGLSAVFTALGIGSLIIASWLLVSKKGERK